MTHAANTVFNHALKLSSLERADIAERLLISLDTPDSSIDAIWAKEADAFTSLLATQISVWRHIPIQGKSARNPGGGYR